MQTLTNEELEAFVTTTEAVRVVYATIIFEKEDIVFRICYGIGTKS